MIWASRSGEAFNAGLTITSLALLKTAKNMSIMLGSNVIGEEANIVSSDWMLILSLKKKNDHELVKES